MPKVPAPPKLQRGMTFLEYVCERELGSPASRGRDYATWCCPFHNDNHPSFCTRPHLPQYKDRWSCFGCGLWGDEFDLLRHLYPAEDYSARLDRLRKLRAEYKATGLEDSVVISQRLGSTAGETILRALLRAGQIDHCDLLEMLAELNHRRLLVLESERLGCKTVGSSERTLPCL